MQTASDITALVRQAQDGDGSAFGQLAQMFQSRVYNAVAQRLRNTAESDEVVQEVFLRAFRKLPQLQDPQRFGAWITQIAVRLSINRAVRRPAETCVETNVFDAVAQPQDSPLGQLLHAEHLEQLRTSIGQLSTLDQETLRAFYFEGASLLEMSQQFQSPVGTIKRRLHTARGRLRELIANLQPA
jgi:RNA polymerase sigma-70 factor (ECF subfamily)